MKNVMLLTITTVQIFTYLGSLLIPGIPWTIGILVAVHLFALWRYRFKPTYVNIIVTVSVQFFLAAGAHHLLKLPVYLVFIPVLCSLFIGMVISIAAIFAAMEKVWKRGRPNNDKAI